MEVAELKSLQDKLNQLEQDNIALKNRVALAEPAPRIMIGVPILSWSHEFALSFLEFWTDLMTFQHKGRKFEVCYNFKFRRPVHLAEEELAQAAVEAGCSHLLLMDDDILGPKAEDLMKLLDADKDVIGGIMHTGGFPYAVCAFRRFDPTKSVSEQPYLTETTRLYEVPVEQRVGVQMVDLIPFAFTLIKTSVFKQLPKPWFSCDLKAPTDSHFADTILTANMQYYAHFDVWLNHKGVTRENVHLWSQLGFMEAQKNANRVVNLSPEEMNRQEVMVQQKMKDAEEKFRKEEARRLKFYEKRSDTPVALPVEPPKAAEPVKAPEGTITNQENKNGR